MIRIGGRGLHNDMTEHEVSCKLLFVILKELLASEDPSSVYITTANKEKYRCLLPSISENSDKASVCIIMSVIFSVFC